MTIEKWDRRFLDLADHVAQWSKDPRTKVGAVIVDQKNRVVSIGYNGFPRGVDDSDKRYENRALKHKLVAHAERNALDNAPLMVEGCTLYVPLMPCNECAKSIVQKGITKVVTYYPDRSGEGFNWDVTKMLFAESGIELYEYSKK
jgi:dCMP deaminase